jgi:hypothetical protein
VILSRESETKIQSVQRIVSTGLQSRDKSKAQRPGRILVPEWYLHLSTDYPTVVTGRSLVIPTVGRRVPGVRVEKSEKRRTPESVCDSHQ